MLQCVAVCCSVLQCVAVCCSVLQCVAACVSITSLLLCIYVVPLRRAGSKRVRNCNTLPRSTWLVGTPAILLFLCFVLFSQEVWFLVFGLLCRHTASNPITAEMHTSLVFGFFLSFFLSFSEGFLWFGRPKPIAGLSGW